MMMYGFGDVPNPRADSVDIMEDLVTEYIQSLCQSASAVVSTKPTCAPGKVRIEDFMFALRKDEKKLTRAEELLFRFDELSKARKTFDATETFQGEE